MRSYGVNRSSDHEGNTTEAQRWARWRAFQAAQCARLEERIRVGLYLFPLVRMDAEILKLQRVRSMQ